MTDKPSDHEEHTRERLRQTTPGDYPVDYAAGMLSDLGVESQTTPGANEVCGEAFSETGRGLDGPDYCALPRGHEGPHNSWAKPGAGEGERWEVWEHLAHAGSKRWCIKRTGAVAIIGNYVAENLTEADADLICTLHNARTAIATTEEKA